MGFCCRSNCYVSCARMALGLLMWGLGDGFFVPWWAGLGWVFIGRFLGFGRRGGGSFGISVLREVEWFFIVDLEWFMVFLAKPYTVLVAWVALWRNRMWIYLCPCNTSCRRSELNGINAYSEFQGAVWSVIKGDLQRSSYDYRICSFERDCRACFTEKASEFEINLWLIPWNWYCNFVIATGPIRFDTYYEELRCLLETSALFRRSSILVASPCRHLWTYSTCFVLGREFFSLLHFFNGMSWYLSIHSWFFVEWFLCCELVFSFWISLVILYHDVAILAILEDIGRYCGWCEDFLLCRGRG